MASNIPIPTPRDTHYETNSAKIVLSDFVGLTTAKQNIITQKWKSPDIVLRSWRLQRPQTPHVELCENVVTAKKSFSGS